MGIRENVALGLAVLLAWTLLCGAVELAAVLSVIGVVNFSLAGVRLPFSLVTIVVVYFDWLWGCKGILAFWPGLADADAG